MGGYISTYLSSAPATEMKDASGNTVPAPTGTPNDAVLPLPPARDEQQTTVEPKKPDAPLVLDEIENVGVSTAGDMVIIRTITDIEDMSYGVGNTYTFKAGVKYRVPRSLADYLEQLGYIWRPN